jgi:hypothetical protein
VFDVSDAGLCIIQSRQPDFDLREINQVTAITRGEQQFLVLLVLFMNAGEYTHFQRTIDERRSIRLYCSQQPIKVNKILTFLQCFVEKLEQTKEQDMLIFDDIILTS